MISQTRVAVLSLFACAVTLAAGVVAGDGESPKAGTQASAEGRIRRDGFDLYYRVFGAKGPYLVLLAGGPGSDPAYMKPVVDELSNKFRCVLLEQRGTGRSRLKSYSEQTIQLSAYLEDVDALRTQLGQEKLLL